MLESENCLDTERQLKKYCNSTTPTSTPYSYCTLPVTQLTTFSASATTATRRWSLFRHNSSVTACPHIAYFCDDRWKYCVEEVGLVAHRKMVIPRCVIWPISVALPRDEYIDDGSESSESIHCNNIQAELTAGLRQRRRFLGLCQILD